VTNIHGFLLLVVVATVGTLGFLGSEKYACAETKIIPSLALSERYDTNILFIAGKQLDDFVTTASPKLMAQHEGRLMEGTAYAGLNANAYMKNPGLNYVGTTAGTSLNLDQAIKKFFPNMGLQVMDNFSYTPEVPSFFASEQGGQAPPGFFEGQQAARANSYTNIGMINPSYQLTPTLSLVGSYRHQMSRFGTAFATPGLGKFFNTTVNVISAGPQYQATALDTFSLTYQYMNSSFSREGGFGSGFETNGGTVGWIRVLTPALKANVSGGITFFQNSLQHTVDAALEWKHQGTGVELHYTRAIMPAFFIAGVALLSESVALTAHQQLTERLFLSGRISYSDLKSVPIEILTTTAYGFGLNLRYTLSPTVSVNTNYTFSHYTQGFQSQELAFDRNIITVSLQADWK
jgi:hypothetical protein